MKGSGFGVIMDIVIGIIGAIASVITQKFRALRWRVHSPGNLRDAMEALQTQEAGLDSYDR